MNRDLLQRLACASAFLLLAAPALAGCADDAPTAPCAVLLDGSGSGDNFDAAKRLDDTFTSFMNDNGCRSMAFVPIDSAPEASTCFVKDVDIDAKVGSNSDPETVRAGRRKLALQRAKEMLACARKNPYSDVIGALRRAAAQRPEGEGTYQMLVVSDMLQNTKDASLYKTDLSTPAAIDAAVGTWTARTPRLAGVRLTITDCGVTLGSGEKAQRVRAFWTRLFSTAQAGNPEVDFER